MLAIRTRNGRNLALVVLSASLITSISSGARSTFGRYLKPVIADLGTGREMFSIAIAIQNLVWGLAQPFTGAVADRFGASRVLSVGAVGYALALVLMSTAQTSGAFVLSMGFLIGLATGAASFSVVLSAVGRMAPPEKATMALGLVTAMGSVGQFVLIPATGSFIERYGWRTTAVILACPAEFGSSARGSHTPAHIAGCPANHASPGRIGPVQPGFGRSPLADPADRRLVVDERLVDTGFAARPERRADHRAKPDLTLA